MWITSLLLLIASVFFVAAEYALVSARRSKVEALARQGNKNATALLAVLDNVSKYVAASQVGITMVGIGVGAVTEPAITKALSSGFARIQFLQDRMDPAWIRTIGFLLSFLIISFVLLVVGELCPKYLALRRPEQLAFLVFRPMVLIAKLLTPVVWLAQAAAAVILKPLGVDMSKKSESEAMAKDELFLLVQAGGQEGILERTHAELLARALKLDVLHARDIMIHRLDMKWIDIGLDRQELLAKLRDVPFNRLPVCEGDVDEMIGIIYVHDVLKHMDDPDFTIGKIIRPAVAVPENLSLDRIVETMRGEKTQMLIIMDEYGGTSGLVTLEDVVEEVFGELEDRLESERPVIESMSSSRFSARAEVRVDELVDRLKMSLDTTDTRTLAQVIVDELERVPRPGDTVETFLGVLRVENMARRRVTRVTIMPRPEFLASDESA